LYHFPWVGRSAPSYDGCQTNTNVGVYGCPGKSLAMLSLRIALSVILRCFDVGFAPGETGKAFEHDALDTLTVVLPPLLLRFTARRQ